MSEEAPDLSRRPWWAGLGWKLFAAFASVIVVGVTTLWLAVGFTAPRFFEQQMAGMMQGSGGMMGGSGGMGTPSMDAALTVAFRDAVTQALLVATAAAVLAAAVASLFVTGRIVAPLRRLAAASRRLADGHYAERVPVPSDDELGDLARSFNAMADVLEATERRRRELIGMLPTSCARQSRLSRATLRACWTGWWSPARRHGLGCTVRRGACADWWTTCRSCRAPRPARFRSFCVQPTRRKSRAWPSIDCRRPFSKRDSSCARTCPHACRRCRPTRTAPSRCSATCSATPCATRPGPPGWNFRGTLPGPGGSPVCRFP